MNLKKIIEYLTSLKQPERKKMYEPQVILDAGHGGFDWGLKTGKTYNKGYKEIMEKSINMEIATRIAWLCARHNMGYLLTRFGDRFVSLGNRVKKANGTKAKLFLSLHCNYARNSTWKGIETYFYTGSAKGMALAIKCQNLLVDLNFTRNRGIKSGNFYVLRKTKMPAILVEFGFLSNRNDATYLNNENNQMLIATKVWEFIKEVCS